MKPILFPWAIFLTVIGCATASEEERQYERYTGVYVAEMITESGKQWDTLAVRKASTVNADSFVIFYADGYMKKLPGGQWTKRQFIRDTFPAIFRHDLNCLLVGDPVRMPLDSVNGQPVRVAPFRPMHVDTVRKSAMFGGFVYRKLE
jgi:hypothetical protein